MRSNPKYTAIFCGERYRLNLSTPHLALVLYLGVSGLSRGRRKRPTRGPDGHVCRQELVLSVVSVRDLEMTFRAPVREEGLRAAAMSLFRREYRDVEAVRGISFDLEAGEVVGFIGPAARARRPRSRSSAASCTQPAGRHGCSGTCRGGGSPVS